MKGEHQRVPNGHPLTQMPTINLSSVPVVLCLRNVAPMGHTRIYIHARTRLFPKQNSHIGQTTSILPGRHIAKWLRTS